MCNYPLARGCCPARNQAQSNTWALLNLLWCKITKVSTVQLQSSCMQTPLHEWVWGAPLLALLSGGNLQHRSSGVLVKRVICKESLAQPCLQILRTPKDTAVAHYLHLGKKVFRSKQAQPKWCIALMHKRDKSLKNYACRKIRFSQPSVRSAFSAKSITLGYSWFVYSIIKALEGVRKGILCMNAKCNLPVLKN